ncbi:MAG: MFS transporter [Natronospirillum sp.]|uniref:MFS transporter n=1 Tax=Natronospirillum sp. TaxID=2812955 RepID=UPI0025D68AD7|nr:MFS transporter [Natronospirillum sp.]MCH8551395.1 MFS transporter [Natronospirillum sp.]
MSSFTDPEPLTRAYERIVGDEDARVCKDIPDAACRHQPRNFFGYLLANLFSKLADELSSARLILPWLLGALGAPSALVGFLVPIREAGVLLPQLVVAAWVRGMPRRKPVWLLGALLSGVALGAMVLVGMVFEGTLAGFLILAALVVYSLARGLCSVAAKDVLGKTVSKERRGTLMGYAAGASGALVAVWGVLLLLVDSAQPDAWWLFLILGVAAICWLVALPFFNLIVEEEGATEGGGNALTVALTSLGILRSDPQFLRFVLGRSALLGVALAAPFLVLLIQQNDGTLAELGALVLLGGLASMISAPIWGRWADRSSRRVMQAAALLGGGLCLLIALLSAWQPDWLTAWGVLPLAFLLLSLSHSGVRLGRKAYLVDMATQDNRATYVAVSNTVVGVLMLVGGLIGWLGDALGIAWVLGLLGLLSLSAIVLLQALPEVTEPDA